MWIRLLSIFVLSAEGEEEEKGKKKELGKIFGDPEAMFKKMDTEEDYQSLVDLAGEMIDFWAENGLEHERCGEMIERIGLVNFLEGVGIEVDPNMVSSTRQSSYVRMDGWDDEAVKWFERKAEAAAAAANA